MAIGMSDTGQNILKLAVLLVIIFVFVVYVPPLFQSQPIVEVTECELASETIGNGGVTSISFTLKSNDQNSAHSIVVDFSSHELVVFKLGSQALPKSGSVWKYTETLNPDASHTQSINVWGSLENGIAKLAYRIDLVFYVDGKEFDRKAFDLTVQR